MDNTERLAEAAKRARNIKALMGEAMHTAFRKAGCNEQADVCWNSIRDMPPDEWEQIVDWVIQSVWLPELIALLEARDDG